MSQVEAVETTPTAAPAATPQTGLYAWYVVGLLTLISAVNYLDRQVVGILIEPLRNEFHWSDSQLGFLAGACFAIPYAIAAIPLGILADRVSRTKLLATVLLIWSGLTAACGLATSYLHLVLIRIGVGAAESPTKPVAVALISDMFPLQKRSTAIGVFWSGSPIGTVVAFVFGTYIAATLGWRNAFLIAGLPGILIGLILFLTVKEIPRRGSDHQVLAKDSAATPVLATFRFIFTQPSLMLMYGGAVLTYMTAVGVVTWMTSFLVRVHGMELQEAGVLFGLAHGATAWIGSILGGRAADYVSKRDVSWIPRVSAVSSALAGLAAAVMLLTGNITLMVICIALWGIAQFATIVPVVGLSQSLVGARMRATSMASFMLISNLLAAGIGPQVVGVLSDVFEPTMAEQSIRYALMALVGFNIVAVLAYLLATRTLKANMERAVRFDQA